MMLKTYEEMNAEQRLAYKMGRDSVLQDWVTCPTCNGQFLLGIHPATEEHPFDEEEFCPDCVDGQTPGPELVAKVDRFSDAYRRGYEAGVRGSLPRRGNTR